MDRMPWILACDLPGLFTLARYSAAAPSRWRRALSPAECGPFRGDRMHRVLILGAGKIGALISGLLAESGVYQVQLADVDGAAAEAVVRAHGAGTPQRLRAGCHRCRRPAPGTSPTHPVEAVISSLPYLLQCRWSRRRRARPALHYFDLTEDVEVTRRGARARRRRERRRSCRSAGLRRASSASPAAELITPLRQPAQREAARRRPAAAPE